MLGKVKNYILKNKIGQGAMGEIFLVINEKDQKPYAMKRISRNVVERPEIRKSVEKERKFLYELQHPNIIRLIEVFITDNYYNIVLDYCNGDSLLKCLKQYIKMYKRPFKEEIVQYLMRQIVDGVKCIHKHNIIHRDLKLDNILVKFYSDEDKKKINMMKARIKISDFGISIKADLAFTAAGSPAYADPIIVEKMNARNDLKNSDGYDRSADIWSLGALCYEMLIGRRIFNGRNLDELCKKVEVGNYSVPSNLYKEALSFLNKMLQYDPNKRLKIDELSMHDFLQKDIKQFSKLNLDLFGSKVENKRIKINIKKNETISELVDEKDEEKISAIYRILNLGTYEEFSQCENLENKIKVPVFQVDCGLSKKNSKENSASNNAMEDNSFRNGSIPIGYNNSKNDSTKEYSEKKKVNKYQMNSNISFDNNSQNNSKNGHQNNYKNIPKNLHINQRQYYTYQNNNQIIPNNNYQFYQKSYQSNQMFYLTQPNSNQVYQNNYQISQKNNNTTYNNTTYNINNISNSANQKHPNLFK